MPILIYFSFKTVTFATFTPGVHITLQFSSPSILPALIQFGQCFSVHKGKRTLLETMTQFTSCLGLVSHAVSFPESSRSYRVTPFQGKTNSTGLDYQPAVNAGRIPNHKR